MYTLVLGQNDVKKTCREEENCRKKKENIVRKSSKISPLERLIGLFEMSYLTV